MFFPFSGLYPGLNLGGGKITFSPVPSSHMSFPLAIYLGTFYCLRA